MVDNATYVYRGTVDHSVYVDTIVTQAFSLEGKQAYYFVPIGRKDEEEALIERMATGLGLFLEEENKLKTVPALSRDALPDASLATRETMLAYPPKKGDRAEFGGRDGTWRHALTVVGLEDVRVPAGRFRHCLKLRTEELDEDEDNTGFVWLAPSVGVVRWERTTGRVDELVSYRIPGQEQVRP